MGIVANQIKPLPYDHERLEFCPDAVPGKFEVTDGVLLVQQARAQGAEVAGEVLQKFIVARTAVSQHSRLVLQEGNDRPLIENSFAVLVVHLRGTGGNLFDSFVQNHGFFRFSAQKHHI